MGAFGPFEIVLLVLIGLAGPVIYVWSLIWAYRDAERRGSNGLLVALLVALAAWPLSILVWLAIRPKT